MTEKEQYTQNAHLTVERKDYNIMIDGQNFFDKPVKNDLKNIR